MGTRWTTAARRVPVVIGVSLALVVGGAGCGKAAEKLAEKASGCEDIDTSGDQVGATCDGVSASADADGNVAVTNEDGSSVDLSADGSAALPEGWPEELAPPEGTNIITSTVSNGDLGVVAALDGDVVEVHGAIKAQLAAAGYTIESDTVSEGADGAVGTLSARGPQWEATVSVSPSTSQPELGSVLVSWTLTGITG